MDAQRSGCARLGGAPAAALTPRRGTLSEPIYHLAPESEIRGGFRDGAYSPLRFGLDGFIHCAAGRAVVLAIAADYFADLAEPLLLLEIDPARLTARCVFEAAAQIPGGGVEHLRQTERFPHIYGPLNFEAIRGIAELGRGGLYRWPEAFDALESFVR